MSDVVVLSELMRERERLELEQHLGKSRNSGRIAEIRRQIARKRTQDRYAEQERQSKKESG